MAPAELATNVVPFPTSSPRNSISEMSMISRRATALDVCYTVYGETPTSNDSVDKFYETNASECYENPFITATSRSVISDIHKLSRQLSSVDVPRPLAVICTLFHLHPPSVGPNSSDFLFQALRVWTDVDDVCESESFDGHRKAIVEHTLNILLLPGIHREGHFAHRALASTDSFANLSSPVMPSQSHHLTSPSLPIPGTSLTFPSPLHLKLRIVTRLSFNEQGLVTHHRDIWDVKDVMGLFPGVSLAQWIGTRIAAAGLSSLSRLLPQRKRESSSDCPTVLPLDLEHGRPKQLNI